MSLPENDQELRVIQFQKMDFDGGWLGVYEHPVCVPFNIRRMFHVSVEKPCQRGKHAHRECTQLISVMSGAVELVVKDGRDAKAFNLEVGREGLLVPPGHWVEVNFVEEKSSISVLCDLEYDESEYIRSWEDYLNFVGEK